MAWTRTHRSRAAGLALLAGFALAGPARGGDWPCPADPLTGEGLPVFNVLDFGATGDGVTDDRSAIQSAIDTASAGGGGVVFFPAGTYGLAAQLSMRSGVIVKGEGPASVIEDFGDQYCFRYIGQATRWIRDTAIRDVQLRGPGFPSEGFSSLVGMDAYVENARIENCLLVDAAYDAWYALYACKRICVVNNHIVTAFDDGLNPGGAANGQGTSDILIQGNIIESVVHDGIHISDQAHAVVAVDNIITHCTNGVGLFRSRDSIVQNNTITQCQAGIRTVQAPTSGFQILGNLIEGVETVGVEVTGADHVIAGNTVRDAAVGIRLRTSGAAASGNTVENCREAGIEVAGGAAVSGVQVLENSVSNVVQGDGIRVDAVCSAIARNLVRAAFQAAIRDVRGFNRVVLNDVDGPIVNHPGDANCDEAVDFGDVLTLLAAWGPCPGSEEDCRADLDADGTIGFADMLIVLANWG